ncbi:hypothetical protein BJF90_30945 [Pseudonocardia sp. CNS-004]|nr:hypothetical protein BJF90_30945 [Pseudonocardia sp. CNS-004]
MHDAFLASRNITTDDLVASELDFSQAGSPPSRSVYIAQADPNQPGGLRQVVDPFTAPEAESYKRRTSRGHDATRIRPHNVFEKPECGPQTSMIQQVPAALGGPLRASRTHFSGPDPGGTRG